MGRREETKFTEQLSRLVPPKACFVAEVYPSQPQVFGRTIIMGIERSSRS